MSGQIQYGPARTATSVQTQRPRPDDECHFDTPVRFGRRRSDQVGHLVLSSQWLRFHGTVDLSVGWTEIARIEQTADEIVVWLHGTRRTLRFGCRSEDEAGRAMTIATHLVALAHSEPLPPVSST